jgi:uncharacterized protein YkwD
MSHVGSDGSTPSQRLTATGYVWGYVAENVAAGQQSTGDVMTAWKESSGHYANMVNERSRDFGAAVAKGSDNTLYWVQCFASPMN